MFNPEPARLPGPAISCPVERQLGASGSVNPAMSQGHCRYSDTWGCKLGISLNVSVWETAYQLEYTSRSLPALPPLSQGVYGKHKGGTSETGLLHRPDVWSPRFPANTCFPTCSMWAWSRWSWNLPPFPRLLPESSCHCFTSSASVS